MLSERGLQIVDKLIENNRIPITSKTLAIYLGVSERSVKTYIKWLGYLHIVTFFRRIKCK